MNTLALSNDGWDLEIDDRGNIKMLTGIEAILQDVASSVRLFLGELYYDTSQGVPYFGQVLGHLPPSQLLQAQLEVAGKTVPGVTGIVCTFKSFTARTLTGTLTVTAGSRTGTVSFGATPGTNPPWYVQAVSISSYANG